MNFNSFLPYYIIYVGFEYGLHYFSSKNDTYILYITDSEITLNKLLASNSHRNIDSSNFTKLRDSGHHMPIFNQHFAYVTVREDIIEVNIDIPQAKRITIGYKILQVNISTEDDPFLIVLYKKENHVVFVQYQKQKNEWEMIGNERLARDQQHHVNHASMIMSAALVKISPARHYFCWIEFMQSVVTCVSIEDYVESGAMNNITYVFSKTCMSPADCRMDSDGDGLSITVGDCQPETEIFHVSLR